MKPDNLDLIANCCYAALAGLIVGVIALIIHGDIQ